MDFEILPHTADIKIRAYGNTKEELFKNALIGMFQSVHPIAPHCHREDDRLICKELPEKHTIDISAPDQESLLIDFLSNALYLSDVYNQAYLDVTINELTSNHLNATVHGVAITWFEIVELKAVTYHDLTIKKHNNIWQVDIVFDI